MGCSVERNHDDKEAHWEEKEEEAQEEDRIMEGRGACALPSGVAAGKKRGEAEEGSRAGETQQLFLRVALPIFPQQRRTCLGDVSWKLTARFQNYMFETFK